MGYISELRKHIGTKPILMAGVCIVVLNENNEILLQHRTDTLDWGTIGGALELGESLEEAARRELYEESMLKSNDLTFKCMISGSDMYFKYPNGDEVYNLVAVYETRDYEGTPTINDSEGSELKYFSLKEPIKNLNPMSVNILRKAGYIK